MPRNGNGTYVLPNTNPVVPDTIITTTWANGTMSDLAAAITQSIAADGQTTVLNDLPMSGYKHTGVGPAQAFDQYTRADQTQRSSLILLVSMGFTAGPPDAYTATLPLGTVTFTNGQMVTAQFPNANTGAATLNINTAGPLPILQPNGSPLVVGSILAGRFYTLCYDGTGWRFLSVVADTASLDARYLKLSGGTMTGTLTLASDPVGGFDATTAQWVMSKITSSVSGVASWNGRTGAVVLTGADVNTALGYTPYNSTNPNGYISGITGAQVTTALGYTPANKAGDTFSGSCSFPGGISCNTVITGYVFKQWGNPFSTSGTVNLDLTTNGQSPIITLTGAVTFNTITVPAASIMRLTLINTNLGVTWPASVKWPYGSTPDLTAGPLKIAVVVLLAYASNSYLASAVIY